MPLMNQSLSLTHGRHWTNVRFPPPCPKPLPAQLLLRLCLGIKEKRILDTNLTYIQCQVSCLSGREERQFQGCAQPAVPDLTRCIVWGAPSEGKILRFLIPIRPWHEPSGASLVAQMVKNLPGMQETQFQSLGQEDPLEKEMATHSSILVHRIPWTEEPSRLQPMGSQRGGHD